MKRRTLLTTAGAGLAGVVGLAGCLNDPDGGSGDGTPAGDTGPTATPTDEPTTTAEGDGGPAQVTVRSVHLQYGLVVPSSPDSIGTWNADTPYLMVLVAVDGDLSRSAFSLAVGDDERDPAEKTRLYRTAWGEYQWYARERPGGLLAFELPAGDPDGSMRLTWPGGEQAVDESMGQRLAAGPPTFSVTTSLPETHDSVEAPPVETEVANEDDVPRRFLGALNRVGPSVAYTPVTRLSELVPPGESVTLAVEDSWYELPPDDRIGDGEPDVTYRLHYAGGEAVADVRIVEST